jgi:hypothetical protein
MVTRENPCSKCPSRGHAAPCFTLEVQLHGDLQNARILRARNDAELVIAQRQIGLVEVGVVDHVKALETPRPGQAITEVERAAEGSVEAEEARSKQSIPPEVPECSRGLVCKCRAIQIFDGIRIVEVDSRCSSPRA